MTIKQISIFAENRPGGVLNVVQALAGVSVDIRALNVADTKDYGIIRMIVSDADKAEKVLAENGGVFIVNDVIGVRIPDAPGGLSAVLSLLAKKGVNVEYLYAFINTSGSNASVVLRVNDNEYAQKVLVDAGMSLLTDDDIKKL